MYSWGRATDGQLGLGGIEDNIVVAPRWNKFLHDKMVVEIGCGLKHTVILLDDGTMHSCGSNEKRQLAQNTKSTSPGLITALDTFHITHVSCGHAHSVAIDDSGSVYTWGDNVFGQLGVEPDQHQPKFFPTRVRILDGCVIVQVACGFNHSLALSRDGRVYSWGENIHGQLGHSNDQSRVSEPKQITDLCGLPIISLAAGGAHNFVLTHSLYVFGWGRNNFKQLGLGHIQDITHPTEVKSLSNECVRYIACGESHTAVLNESGEVLTFGCASSGQLGHGSLDVPNKPTKIDHLDGREVCQIACGRNHTLVVQTTGEVYSFGLGAGGQLGVNSTTSTSTPALINYNWKSEPPRQTTNSRKRLLQLSESTEEIEIGSSVDPPVQDELMEVDEPMEQSDWTAGVSMQSDWTEVISLRRVFAGGDQSFACVVRVQRSHADATSPTPSLSCDLANLRVHQEEGVPEEIDSSLEDIFMLCNASTFNKMCLSGGPESRVTEVDSRVDLERFRELFETWRERESIKVEEKKLDAIVQDQLLPSLPSLPLGVECLRVLYVLPLYLRNCPQEKSTLTYMKKFTGISLHLKETLGKWFFNGANTEYIKSIVKLAHDILHRQLSDCGSRLKPHPNKLGTGEEKDFVKVNSVETDLVLTVLQFLEIFHKWNLHYNEPIKHTLFHEELIFDLIDLIEDFFSWLENKPNGTLRVVFCKYPFILDASSKGRLMMIESRIQMKHAVTQAQTSNFHSLLFAQSLSDPSPFAYQLTVDRNNLIRDTLRQLVMNDDLNFKKPLHISFVDEEGEDAGGVQKEFFMLLLQEILNPDFGMFTEDDESHMIWFRDNPAFFSDEIDHFVLIGILCGLAIYNSVIIDVPFPMAMYKKLLGWSPDVADLVEMFPSVGHSLQELLAYDREDFVDTFDLNFTITRSVFGEVMTVDLVKDGSNKVVTMANRHEYCSAYVNYMFNTSVKGQFDAFSEGFRKVCDGKVMRMMHPGELMTLMVGIQVVNWEELQKHMTYRNGYSTDHQTIKLFWEVFNEFSTEIKKKFLVFYTGSNRIPIAGVKSMNMLIQRMDGGPGCDKLPVAHTCFNILDLPPYDTKTKMKQKLLQAINFTSGFGIV